MDRCADVVGDGDFASTYYLLGFQRALDLVVAQTRCSRDDATDLLLHRAEAEQRTLGDLAITVLDGELSDPQSL
jgi:hypothetical protein